MFTKMAQSNRIKDIFISYGREEGVLEFVKQLKADLEVNGVSVWLDADDIPAGCDFHVEIGVALKSCRALIPVLTKKYVQSRYCKGELYVAYDENKALLPVIYEDGWNEGEKGAGVNYVVKAFNWAFFRPNRDDHQDSLKKLVEGAKLNLRMADLRSKVEPGGMVAAVKSIEKWQELGYQLNINPEMLSKLFNSGQSGAKCRDEMVAYWEKHDNDASWEKLARALARMGENQLAEGIIKEHSLPMETLVPKEEQATTPKNEEPDNTDVPDSANTCTSQGDDSMITTEDKEAMTTTNEDEIQHNFAMLIDRLRNALKQSGIEAADINRYLKDMKVDFQSQVSDLETIFDYLKRSHLWSYDKINLVESLNKRFLGANSPSIKQHILDYKGKFNGYLAMKKIIHSEYFVVADDSDDIEDPATVAAKYGTTERHKLKVKLELGGRKLSEVSLLYIAELWESFQEEYELPALTAQIDYIMKKCLEIVWLISPIGAEKIRSSKRSHLPFFWKHNITFVSIDDDIVYQLPDPEEQERRKQQASLEMKNGDAQLERGDYQLAAECYSKAMELDPSSPVFPASKAKALFQQQLYAGTEECCSISLALDENNARMYLLRAKARSKLGKLELAVQDFQSTLKLEPSNMEANMHSARLEGELRRRAKRAKEEGPAKQSPSSCLGVPQQPIKKKCSLAEEEAQSEVCEISHQSAPELEVAQTLDEWEISLRTILGERVLVTDSLSTEIPVTIFEEEGAVVGLFFSAIWCPPSKEFTPKLMDWYKRFKSGPNGHLLDIVFISSDFDDSEFREYCQDMPGWYALDFKDREKEANLAARFKVNAIPTLVFIDGKTGKLISMEGRSIVDDDPNGEQFPWKPKPFLDIVAGAKLIDQDKKEIEWEQLQGKTIGLFFSADWCPPGQQITPTLAATYHKLKESRQDFEFVYVSSDKTEEEWKASLASMPWPSFHYGDQRPKMIRKSFRIDSIPTLILLDEKGGLITTEGLTYVCNDQDGETFPWYVNALTEYTVEYINDVAYLIWFVPKASASRAKELLEPLAKEYISKKARENMEVKLMFFIAGEENETSVSIRGKARLPSGDPLLAIIDVPRNQVHVADHSELSEENVKKFVYDYLQRRLTGRRLR